ncbi:GspE/PulE family protein [Zunongwangia atlantica 22II14-10F7]
MAGLLHTDLKQLITAEEAYAYRIIPSSYTQESIRFLSDTSSQEALVQELSIIYNKNIHIELTTPDTLTELLAKNYRKSSQSETLDYNLNFLEKLLITAKNYGSSDIHIEPYEKYSRVRFRIDGHLIEQFKVNQSQYPQIVNQVKIKAGLDISQKRLSQDGRIAINAEGNEFDIRVSCLPTLHGEKIVMRILKRDTSDINLEHLGFTKKELQVYKEGIKNPNGIILISGPTGSGKTTTLYGTLKLLNAKNGHSIPPWPG